MRERRVMVRSVRRMTLVELRHELRVIPIWIRDITGLKQARMREIGVELERRKQEKCKLDDRLEQA
jgi:hypothetical protein